MEITVECVCGTKYRFDVEPVHGRMPAPVSCPACGADGTASANEFLRTAVVSQPPPPASPPPLPPDIPAPADPAGPQINPPVEPEPMAPAYAARPRALAAPAAKSNVFLGILTALLVVACIGIGSWRMGVRMMNRFRTSEMVKALNDLSFEDGTNHQANFMFEESVVLFIRHSDQSEVAQACKDYWNNKIHRPLLVRTEGEEEYGNGLFELWPASGGYVQLFGGLDWPQAQYEGLAQYLSQRFDTLVFEVREVHVSGPYHFGVYEQGTRKFHAQMAVNDDLKELVATEGNDWALTNGYEPGPEGFKQFRLSDGDAISQRLGLKVWDNMIDDDQPSVWLQEMRSK